MHFGNIWQFWLLLARINFAIDAKSLEHSRVSLQPRSFDACHSCHFLAMRARGSHEFGGLERGQKKVLLVLAGACGLLSSDVPNHDIMMIVMFPEGQFWTSPTHWALGDWDLKRGNRNCITVHIEHTTDSFFISGEDGKNSVTSFAATNKTVFQRHHDFPTKWWNFCIPKKDHNKVSHAFVAQVNPPTSVFRGQVSTTQKGLMADDGQGGVSILLLEATVLEVGSGCYWCT